MDAGTVKTFTDAVSTLLPALVQFASVEPAKRTSEDELRHFGFDLRLAFEDDRRNVAMFHAEGIPCVYIHSGYYDLAEAMPIT